MILNPEALLFGNPVAQAACAADCAAATAGCGNRSSDRAAPAAEGARPAPGGTIVRRIEADCKTLNWVLFTTTYENEVLSYLYDKLIDLDRNLEYVPVLAKDWEISDDHLRITIHLRDDIHWHDGVPITSHDVKFTMDRVMDPLVPAINKRGYFTRLDHVETPDSHTVVFVWKEPYAPAMAAIQQIAPIPEHVYGKGDFLTHPANRAPVGSGPFRFEKWKTGQYISIVRYDDYHGQKAWLDRIIFRVIEDNAVALSALRAGEIDEMRVTQIQWERQTNDPDFESRFEKYYYYMPSYNYIGWNNRSVWFRDRRVRLAMTLLFDRESINKKIYSGFAKLVSGPFYVNSWAYDKSVKPHPYDPRRAAKLLDEAGWTDHDGDGIRDRDGVKFEFELLITASNIAQQFAQLLQESCRKVGVVVRIRQLEGATFFDRIDSGQFDACALAWQLDPDPDVYDTFHSSMVPPKGLNHVFYSNARVDSLLEAGRREFDRERRASIYHAIHREMHRDPPYTFVNTVPEKRPISRRIHGVVISPLGPFDFYPGARYWYINTGQDVARP